MLVFGGDPNSLPELFLCASCATAAWSKPGSVWPNSGGGSDLTCCNRGLLDLTLLLWLTTSASSSSYSISSWTDSNRCSSARLLASSFFFSCSSRICLSIARVLCFRSSFAVNYRATIVNKPKRFWHSETYRSGCIEESVGVINE